MKSTLLIIDDEVRLSALLSRILELEGHRVLQAPNAKTGLRLLEQEDIRVVLSDVKLPDVNGVDLVKKIKAIRPYVEVINLTAYGTISDGVMAIKNGAFDYLTKGDDNEKIIPLVSKAVDKANLQFRVQQLEAQMTEQYGFERILGQSTAIKDAIALAQKVAKTEATVLLLGETGTGKEVFAQAIHQDSLRRNKPFVAVNCSTFSKELLESELFGHKAGAFTGALKDKKGLFEEASSSTIFLDEIGEMDHDLQAKLLRVLEDGTFIKVGETKVTKVDIRLITATNRHLQSESENGHFRLDLFYRLSGFIIELPPLRERREDIEALIQHFIKIYAAKVKKRVPEMSEAFLEAMKSHSWKGNIRELKNVIERVMILMNEPLLTPQLQPFDDHYNSNHDTEALDLATVEKYHIRRILKHTKGNKAEAARVLGIGVATLYRKIEEYHLLTH